MANRTGTPFNDNDSVNGIPLIFRPRLVGTQSSDTIDGLAGDDILEGLGGDDFLFGGPGFDQLDGGDNNDLLDGGDGNDLLLGGGGNDRLFGRGGNESLLGQAGDDLLDGGTGFDTFFGGDGNDTLSGGDGNDIISGDDGNDSLSGDAGNDRLFGNAGDDLLVGGTGVDELFGNAGNDVLSGGIGNDKIDGEDGFDTASYLFAPKPVTVDLARGRASGGDGNDTLVNVEGIAGSNFNDTLTGGKGSNQFTGNNGHDSINGQDGFDSAIYSTANAAVTVNLTADTATGGAGNDSLVSIEGSVGSTFDDILIGAGEDNTLVGDAGNDVFDGRAGSDVLFGDGGGTGGNTAAPGGNDTLIGGTGNDFFNGEAGLDTADYSNLGRAITLLPLGVVNKGNLATDPLLGTDSLFRVERIVGATGQTNAIDASGATGGVSIRVNLAKNSLIVNDIPGVGTRSFTVENFTKVTGTSNIDVITGDDGDDILNGGVGSDTLTGGSGDDIFDFNFVNLQPPQGIDTITDFAPGDFNPNGGDKVRILSSQGTLTLDQFTFNPTTGALFFEKTQFASLQLDSGFDIGRDLLIA